MNPSVSDGCRWTRAGSANGLDFPRTLPDVMGGDIATLRAFIREYLFVSLFRACAESLASENASRVAAMQRSDKNTDELLEDLNGHFIVCARVASMRNSSMSSQVLKLGVPKSNDVSWQLRARRVIA